MQGSASPSLGGDKSCKDANVPSILTASLKRFMTMRVEIDIFDSLAYM